MLKLSKISKYGHFVDSNEKTLDYQELDIRVLKGKPYRFIWWLKKRKLQLLQTVYYEDPFGIKWTIPAGFVFNGLSVPWWAWPICPADHPDALAGSLVHDYCCTKPYPCDDITGAFLFWAAMRCNGMYRWGAFRNWFFVRWFGPKFERSDDACPYSSTVA